MKSDDPVATVALAGNPNCGKTTLFNGLTGSNQRIGNWPGVTVERKEGFIELRHTDHAENGTARRERGTVSVIDLPGIYALSATSDDEVVARDYIMSGEPDVIVNVVDATNLQRNLYLTLQLVELGVPMVVVLNMSDRARKDGIQIDAGHLESHLGCPVLPISALESSDIRAVRTVIQEALIHRPVSPARVVYPQEVETHIEGWAGRLSDAARTIGASERWVALKLLERDPWVTEHVGGTVPEPEIEEAIATVSRKLGDDSDVVLADARYGFIHGLTRTVSWRRLTRQSFTDRADRIVMSRFLGIPVFLLVMYMVFWTTITVGGAFIDFFDLLFGAFFVDGFGVLLTRAGSPPWLIAIAAGGIGTGVQTVATFIPVIFMMFFMLSLLEDSGYMARAAFVMDRFMRWIGLPGKSFVPMMVGFGCTVPAILGTRTLESKKDRLMTAFMAPFMSCGARLPVYALFGAAFFQARSGAVVFSLYVIGIVLAVLTGLLLKLTVFRGAASHFIMELPPYHAPRLRQILRIAGGRMQSFVMRAGVTITIAVTLLSILNSVGTDGTLGNENTERSVLALIGKTATPVFRPMGIDDDNWPATVGLFTGIFAKEAIVGTLSSIYGQGRVSERDNRGLVAGVMAALRSVPDNLVGVVAGFLDPAGARGAAEAATESGAIGAMRRHFSRASAYAYLLFVLIYFPCIAALGAGIREMGAGYGWLMAGYLTVLAWSLATLAYQMAVGPQSLFVILPIGALAAIGLTFYLIGRRSEAPP